ncbi:hypothetical protein GQX74_008888 [Glossina fuscipes]|nr:hypothetical protein GQX74_008888 [Glossina fuscipes]
MACSEDMQENDSPSWHNPCEAKMIFMMTERNIILISTIRSSKEHIPSDVRHALGFIQNEKRINVAIIVYGNPDLLLLDRRWRAIIKYCVDNDAYLGRDLPELSVTFM